MEVHNVHAEEVDIEIVKMKERGYRYICKKEKTISALSSDEPIDVFYTLFFE